jgi:hypothetical protein
MFVSVSFLTTDVEGEVTTGSLQYRARIVDDFCPFVSIGVEGGVGTGQLLFILRTVEDFFIFRFIFTLGKSWYSNTLF